MMRLQGIDRPIRIHQHADGSILADQDRQSARFQFSAVRRSRGFENALGVGQKIAHQTLIGPEDDILSKARWCMLNL